MEFLKKRWPEIVLWLAPLLVLWPAVFLGQVPGPWANLAPMALPSAPNPAQPWDVLQADAVLQFYPWRDLVFESWSRFELPLWNPYVLSGTPLLANSQSAGLYPPHLLVGVLPIPTGLGITLLAWFHLAWAAWGTFRLVRILGRSREAGVVAGLGFGLSSFLISWVGLSSVISTCAWIPWVLAAVVGAFESETPGPRRLLSLGLPTGMMLLAGHLQFAAYGLMAAVILAVGTAIQARRAHPLALILAGLVLGATLSSAQVLPVLEYSKFSHRAGTPTAEGYAAYQASAVRPVDAVRVAYANSQGRPSQFDSAEGAVPISEWSANRLREPNPEKFPSNFAERAFSWGPVLLVLVLAGVALIPRKLFPGPWVALLGFALMVAIGTPLAQFLYFWVPGWSSTGSPGRILVLGVLVASVLAGLGYDACCQRIAEAKSEPRLRGPLVVGLALALLLLLMQASGPIMALAGVASLALVLWAVLRQRVVVILAGIAATTLLSDHGLRMGRPFDLPPEVKAGSGERLAVRATDWHLLRQPEATFPPNLLTFGRQLDWGGYDSLLHRDSVALLRETQGRDPAPMENGNMMLLKTINPEVLARLGEAGVSAVILREGSNFRKLEVPTQGRAFTPQGQATVVQETLRQLTIRAEGPGPLRLRDRWMPGWTATVNGQPVEVEAEGPWRIVRDLPAGPQTIVFSYWAPGLTRGLTLTGLGILACLGLGVWGRRSRRLEAER